MKRFLTFFIFAAFAWVSVMAQDVSEPEFVPMVKVGKTLVDGDTIQ